MKGSVGPFHCSVEWVPKRKDTGSNKIIILTKNMTSYLMMKRLRKRKFRFQDKSTENFYELFNKFIEP